MPDDRHTQTNPAAAVLLALACLACASAAGAQTLRGYGQVQYQSLRNGKVEFDREWWVTSFQADYAARLRPTLDLTAQFQFTKLDFAGRPEGSRVPFGSLRLTHTQFGVFGSYRPTTQTDGLGFETHQKQTLVSGYWARTGWPRLDLNWIRRRLETEGRTNGGGTGTTRYATLTHGIGPVSVRGGYTDQAQESDDIRARRVFQRAWNAGSTYLYGGATSSLVLQYDFTDNRRDAGDVLTDVAQTHAANASGGKRLSPRTDLNLNYSFRRTRTRNRVEESFNDNEGALLFNYAPSPPFRVSTGGGVRTVRGGPSQDLEEYLLLSASADGRIRHNLTGGAGAAYSVNWSPGADPRAANSYRANTTMQLWRGLDLSGALQVNVSERPVAAPEDSAAIVRGRISTQTNLRAATTPLRAISVSYGYSLYRVGESLTGPAPRSSTTSWDFRWQPLARFQATGNVSHTKGLGQNDGGAGTARVNVQWDVAPTFQISGSYARSDRPRRDPAVELAPGAEILNLRVLTALTRDLRANVGMNWVDPGTSRSVRQVDATLTQRFGG